MTPHQSARLYQSEARPVRAFLFQMPGLHVTPLCLSLATTLPVGLDREARDDLIEQHF